MIMGEESNYKQYNLIAKIEKINEMYVRYDQVQSLDQSLFGFVSLIPMRRETRKFSQSNAFG